MASRRFARKPPAGLCTELTTEDGIDPRFVLRHSPAPASNRKALQLCRQVERALGLSLKGDLLRDLTVQSVHPAPDSSRLMVVFAYHGPASDAEVLAALHDAQARLRAEVAASIHRRKTPELTFQVIRAR